MFLSLPGRYDSSVAIPFGAGHVKYRTPLHRQNVDTLLTVIPPIIEPLNGKWIAECQIGFLECDAMLPEICDCFLSVPFKLVISGHCTACP